MIYLKPYFYDYFKCKADKCTDTCCAGWEVDIDDESFEKYNNISGEFGKRLNDGIVYSGDIPCFRLCENERCVFLNQDNLCDIYSELGEEYLCEICREHPRFYNCFDNLTEMGLGLCCEKVCEMIFSSEKPITFITECVNEKVDDEYEFYAFIRNKCFDIVCNRNKPLKDRINDLIVYGVSVQNDFFCKNIEAELNTDVENVFQAITDLFLQTEPINDEWTEYIHNIKSDLKDIVQKSEFINLKESEYEQILTYILYRHFMTAMNNGDVLSIICFSIVNLIFLYLADCKMFSETNNLTFEDRINNVKLWSKQIEYSEENTHLIIDKAIETLLINK